MTAVGTKALSSYSLIVWQRDEMNVIERALKGGFTRLAEIDSDSSDPDQDLSF